MGYDMNAEIERTEKRGIDKRNKLTKETFSYKISKDKKVFIYYYGKLIKILKDSKAENFIADINGTEDKEMQLVMAKATGNFKRGNERSYKTAIKII